jgi:hypothetical protein
MEKAYRPPKSIDPAGRLMIGLQHAQPLEVLVVVNLTAGIALGEQLFAVGVAVGPLRPVRRDSATSATTIPTKISSTTNP